MLHILLIVDDDPDIMEILQYSPEAEGYHVIISYTGKYAMALVESKNPVLILIDIRLRDLDGREICRRNKAGKHMYLPVIFISAQAALDMSQELAQGKIN